MAPSAANHVELAQSEGVFGQGVNENRNAERESSAL
jgi:hypothetical protein